MYQKLFADYILLPVGEKVKEAIRGSSSSSVRPSFLPCRKETVDLIFHKTIE